MISHIGVVGMGNAEAEGVEWGGGHSLIEVPANDSAVTDQA